MLIILTVRIQNLEINAISVYQHLKIHGMDINYVMKIIFVLVYGVIGVKNAIIVNLLNIYNFTIHSNLFNLIIECGDDEKYSKMWGINCKNNCGKCKNNETCNYINGICKNVCENGFTTNFCNRKTII